MENTSSSNFNFLTLASIVICLAALKLSQTIVIPLLLAIFISIISSPLLFWLKSKKIPNWLSLLILLSVISGIGFIIALIIGSSATSFSKNIPFYETQLRIKFTEIFSKLSKYGINSDALNLKEVIKPSTIIQFISSGLNQVGSVLAQSFLILFVVAFILLEVPTLYEKFKSLYSDNKQTVKIVSQFLSEVHKYMLIKSIISVCTGIIITIFLMINNIHYPFLWGFLAFILNFVPSIGSIIAAIPVILLAIIQYDFSKAFIILIAYLIVNTVLGNMIEPKFMGSSLRISPLLVVLSLIFWGWLLGPIGMLLAMPLTMVVKIGLGSHPNTKKIALLISSTTL